MWNLIKSLTFFLGHPFQKRKKFYCKYIGNSSVKRFYSCCYLHRMKILFLYEKDNNRKQKTFCSLSTPTNERLNYLSGIAKNANKFNWVKCDTRFFRGKNQKPHESRCEFEIDANFIFSPYLCLLLVAKCLPFLNIVTISIERAMINAIHTHSKNGEFLGPHIHLNYVHNIRNGFRLILLIRSGMASSKGVYRSRNSYR